MDSTESTKLAEAPLNSSVCNPTKEGSCDDTSWNASAASDLAEIEIDLCQQSSVEEQQHSDHDETEDSYLSQEDDEGHEEDEVNINNKAAALSSTTASIPTNSDRNEISKKVWKEQSREAVNISLRAEKEKISSKRRLLSDMYTIMTNDELPFTVKQKDEDRLDQWIIQLNGFDEESDLYKDLLVLGLDCVEMQMTFPDDYPFVPPFVYVSRPRFARGTGFVIDGALCMELLTPQGWSPANSVETVIVSIQSHLVIGRGRLHGAVQMGEKKRKQLLEKIKEQKEVNEGVEDGKVNAGKKRRGLFRRKKSKDLSSKAGAYTAAEATRSFQSIMNIHKKDGWSKYWVKKG